MVTAFTVLRLLFSPINCIYSALVAAFALSAMWITYGYNLPYRPTNAFYSVPLLLGTILFVVGFLVVRSLVVMVRCRNDKSSLFLSFWYDVREYMNWPRLVSAAPILLLTPIFFSLFTCVKNAIPQIVPFYMDPFLARWDSLLHGGLQPWQWLQPAIGIPLVTMLLSLVYKSWFFVKYGFICWQAFRWGVDKERDQFFLTLILSWLLIGVVLATLFSSVGPCYFGLVYPDLSDPYRDLMTYLYSADEVWPVFDLFAQDFLWRAYQGETAVPFSGISAMPSMHLSMVMLIYLSSRSMAQGWRYFYLGYLIVIFVGSVHLGWHYALDGYVSMILTYLIWRFSGIVVSFYREKSCWEGAVQEG